jgi:hypothetical protein
MRRYKASSLAKLNKIIKAHFHADHHSGRYNAPGWYRRQYRRPTKLANEAMLRKALRADEYDDLSLIPFKANAQWYWW